MSEEPKVYVPIRYDPRLHFEQVRQWNAAHGEVMLPDALPQSGFIIPGKAAGFLYRTDSCLAWIESLVASPDIKGAERGQAIDAVVLAVCEEGRRLGFRILMGHTVLDAVVQRAQRLGFIYVQGGFHMIAMSLQEPKDGT